jgi:diguanylate cyclase (GGDEF)-like protein
VALVVVSSCAATFGLARGPVIKPFVPIAVTAWSLADLLTAFLLIAQFYVNGNVSLAILSGAYAFSGCMSVVFLIAFPGLFRSGRLTLGDEQISSVAWYVWHCTFPALLMFAALYRHKFRQIASRRTIRIVAAVSAAAPLVAASTFYAVVYAYRNVLPILIIHGDFQPFYRTVLLPIVVLLNVAACIVLLARRRALPSLTLWLAVATFSAAVDCLMVNLSTARYSFAWDTGKLLTVFTSTIVLIMMLCDIVVLYGRLALGARIDELTLLYNRRGYEEHFRLVYDNARRLKRSLGVIVVDIDFFKRYNDAYGHLAGDACLQAVAKSLASSATRPLDLVARFGGEEFAVILPNTSLAGMRHIGERIRSAVERLDVSYAGKSLGRVTVSVGIGHVTNALDIAATALFEAADHALYRAKNSGRNQVIVCDAVDLARAATGPATPAGAPAIHEPEVEMALAPQYVTDYDQG